MREKSARAKRAFDQVAAYAEARGVAVIVEPGPSEFDIASRTVRVNSKYTPQTRLYVLLHELGHFLICDQRGARDRFPRGWDRGGLKQAKSRLARTDIVLEEVEAWDRGLRLADRLGVWYDRAAFDRCRSDRLRSYFAYALRDLWGEGWTRALPKSEGG
jgi:hypothetical protein